MEDVAQGMFHGISLDSTNLVISHIFYADDAFFQGEWNKKNIRNLIRILRCFYMVLSLRINLLTSNLLGFRVAHSEVSSLAYTTVCYMASLSFSYPGLPVGQSMVHVKGWETIIDNFSSSVSSWKVKMLSIGGRLTLIKVVLGSLCIYFFSLFRVPSTICHMLEICRSRFFWGKYSLG